MAQGSSCLSHDLSSTNSNDVNCVVKDNTKNVKFRTRYVYSKECNPKLCQYLLGMSKNQSVKFVRQKVKTSGTWFKNMTTNSPKLANSYGPMFSDARLYAQVLKDGDQKGVTDNNSVASKTKGVNLNRSVTSVVSSHCHNSLRDYTGSISHSKNIDKNRSYASVVGNAANITKDNSISVDTSPPRSGVAYGRDIAKDSGAGNNKHPGNSDLNPGNKMGQEMATSVVPVSMTPKALAPEYIAVNGIGSEDNAIYDKIHDHDSEGGTKTHVGDCHNCKIFDINSLDEKYLTSILLNTPKKKLWKNQITQWSRFGKTRQIASFALSPCLIFMNLIPVSHSNYCPIEAHKIVAAYGKPNYLGARIMVDS